MVISTLSMTKLVSTKKIHPVMFIDTAQSSRAIKGYGIFHLKILDLCSLISTFSVILFSCNASGRKLTTLTKRFQLSHLHLLIWYFSFISKKIWLPLPRRPFRRYIQYLSLLLFYTMSWSFNFVTLFYHALPLDL